MKKFFIFIAIFFSLITYCYADTFTVVTDPQPPFADPSSVDHGIVLCIVKESYKIEGHNVKIKYLPWARAIAMTRKGKYDILACAWDSMERRKSLVYSDPILTNEIVFIKKNNSNFNYDGDLTVLNGKTIGIIRGYSYLDDIDPNINFKVEPVHDIIMNVQKLLAGRIDLLVEDKLVARVSISSSRPDLFTKLTFIEEPLSAKLLYITSPRNDRGFNTIKIFNSGFSKIKENGIYDKIMNNSDGL